MIISYGLARDPCTLEVINPFEISIESTWPLRAYERPRSRRAPISKLSSTAIHLFAHQLCPNEPRLDCDLIPPLVLILGFGLYPQYQSLITSVFSFQFSVFGFQFLVFSDK